VGGSCRKHGEIINAHTTLEGKLKRMRHLGTPRRVSAMDG
jgi:hypothetical protein